MTYDLFLSSPKLSPESFARYFAERPHYERAGWYSNAETGVYFGFEYARTAPNEGEGPVSGDHVAFNMNFIRPHTFGLEAEPELSAFVEAFDCVVHDPQPEGMGDGPYSAHGFLRGWNKGNAFGCGAIVAQVGREKFLLADGGLIEHVWRWNLGLRDRQGVFGESRFLPPAHWGKRLGDGAPVAFAVWGEGIPTALPECATHVLLMRKQRPRGFWLAGSKREVMEACLVSMEDVRSLGGCTQKEFEGSHLLLTPIDTKWSRRLTSSFGGQFGEPSGLLKRFAPDHVIDSSLMATAQEQPTSS